MIALGFSAIVAGVAAAILAIVRAAARRAHLDVGRLTAVVGAALGLWLAVTGIAAASGALRLTGGPPRVLLLPLAAVFTTQIALRTRTGRALAAAIPPAAVIALQTFRIFVELVLWRLFVAGQLPIQMTFEGRNFDVLVGLTALPVAALVARTAGRRLATLWHLASLGLLLNIVATAVLSAPGPLQVFTAEPANRIIGDFPFVWLPAFLVPVALVSHILGLRGGRAKLPAP